MSLVALCEHRGRAVSLILSGCLIGGVVCGRARDSGESDGGELADRSLAFRVEVASDLSQYRTTSVFTYRPARGADVYFVVPGVDDPSELEVTLDGRAIDPADVLVAPHPIHSGRVFRPARETGATSPGMHRLSVSTPWLREDQSYFAHWGGWHPYLGDRAHPMPIEMEVVASARQRVVASGKRIDERVRDGTRTSRWRTRNPQAWVFLAIGEYLDTTLVQNGMPFEVWLPANGNGVDAAALVDEPSSVFGFLERSLGRAGIDTVRIVFFPDTDLVNFSIDGLVAGTSATLARISAGPQYLRGFLAHELAHYWFGDLLQGRGQGARWLSEGFAEYWRYRYEEAVGAEPLPWSFRNQLLLNRFGTGTDMPTLLQASPDDPDELFYHKGAFVLFMLERHVGRDAFDDAAAAFVARHKGTAVRPLQFFSTVEEVSGSNLSWFIEQWMERPRGPVIDDPDPRLIEQAGRFLLEIDVHQAEPAYRLDLPIVIETADATPQRFVRPVSGAVSTLRFDLDTRPTRVTIDPSGEVLKWFPPERLPVDFNSFRQALLRGVPYHVDADDGSESWQPVRDWIRQQFGSRTESDNPAAASYRILLGARAARAREHLAPELPAPPDGVIQAFIRRDMLDPDILFLGIEGAVPDPLPPILPEAPLSFIAFRDGSIIGAHATATPVLSREIVRAPEMPR